MSYASKAAVFCWIWGAALAWSQLLPKVSNTTLQDFIATGIPKATIAQVEYNGGLCQNITFPSGQYLVLSTIVLTVNDSCLRISGAASGEPTILTAGVTVSGWQLANHSAIWNGTIWPVWTAPLPEPYRSKLAQRASDNTPVSTPSLPSQLFINGQRRLVARSPNPSQGPSKILNRTDLYAGNGSTFTFAAPLEPAAHPGIPAQRLISLASIMLQKTIYLQHSWSACRQRLGNSSINPTNSTIMFQPPGAGESGCIYAVGGFPKDVSGNRWVLENSMYALDMPGEWYADPNTAALYYIPFADESMNTTVAILPVLSTILSIVGSSDAPISNVVIESIIFENFDTDTYAIGEQFAHTGAIVIANATNITLFDVTIQHGGVNGLQIGAGAVNVFIQSCNITDVGGHGIYMVAENDAANTTIANTSVTGIGQVYFDQPTGILVNGESSTVTNCHVADSPYAGIQVVWLHGSAIPEVPAPPAFNISYNIVENYGLGVLSDFGGLRAAVNGFDDCWLNSQYGCYLPVLFANNIVRHGRHFGYGSNGIYTDQATAGVVAVNNIIYDVGHSGVQVHCGLNNTFLNNMFIDTALQWYSRSSSIYSLSVLQGCASSGGYAGWPSPPPNVSLIIERNIFYMTSGIVAEADEAFTGAFQSNTYYVNASFEVPSKALRFPGSLSWSAWQGTGQDTHSILLDPQVTDPANGNFTLAAGSPSLAIGFEQIGWQSAGLLPPS